MKQSTARIFDPNYISQRINTFRNDGRNIISMMRSNGIDKSARDEMRIFLAEKQTDLFKKSANAQKEVTRYGSPLTASAFASDSLGIYNPDTIPITTYDKMKADPQIAIGLSVIKMPIYSLGWSVECDDPDIREFVKITLKAVWKKLIRSMLTAIDYGFASHEKVWWLYPFDISTIAPNGRKKTHFKGKAEVYRKIKPHYPGSIKIRTDSKTDDFLGILQSVGSNETKLDADKCFLFSLNADFGNFFGQSRLRPAYKPWYWKEVISQFMLRYFERRGSPATVVTHPVGGGIDVDGNEYDNSEIALRIGQNLVENSVVTLPFEANRDGINQWNLDYLQDEKRGEMFVEALNYLGAQELRALLIPERVMTQDLSTGSFSMASSHAEIFLLSEEGLVAEMESAINATIIPPLVQYNFKPKKIVECNVRIESIQYDRKRILKEILIEMIRNMNTMVKTGKAPNLMPSLSEMSEVLGIPLRTFDEEWVDANIGDNGQEVPIQKDPNASGDTTKEPTSKEPVKREPAKKEEG
jgi:hypothetical protein